METIAVRAYARVKASLASDPDLEARLLDDLPGTLAERFGLRLDAPAQLQRRGEGYRLVLDGRTYDLADPRGAAPGELDEAELELVSGGHEEKTCQERNHEAQHGGKWNKHSL